MSDVFTFIAAERANYPIVWMCRLLAVSRASFYRWLRGGGPSPREVRHRELAGQVKAVYDAAGGQAGRDQIVKILAEQGIAVAVATVGAIMRELGIKAVRTKAWKKTTEQDPSARTEHIKNHMLDDDGSTSPRIPLAPGCVATSPIYAQMRAGCIWLP